MGNEEPPQARLWRTLAHVQHISPVWIWVDVPGWHNPRWVFMLDVRVIPKEIRDRLRNDDRLHVKVNVGAEDPGDIVFTGWELAEPHEELNHRSTDET